MLQSIDNELPALSGDRSFSGIQWRAMMGLDYHLSLALLESALGRIRPCSAGTTFSYIGYGQLRAHNRSPSNIFAFLSESCFVWNILAGRLADAVRLTHFHSPWRTNAPQ
ncbi:MAG: hypothetical protein J2P37_33865 [Ktedonobacteraceae bacterium]|nr:hypothetical protein [Ktedonobacteraceae bacterium]